MFFINLDNFNSYVILLILRIILKDFKFLQSRDLFNLIILIFLLFNIIKLSLRNFEINILYLFAYFF